jgi:hypothetical protein
LFVESGGTLIIETGFGMYDERMFFNPAIPPFGLTDVFGYQEGESFYMENTGGSAVVTREPGIPGPNSEKVYTEGHLDFSEPIAAKVKAHTYLTPITVSSAKVIAKYESMPVAAVKNVGRGQVYYFGTNLGASVEEGDQSGLDVLTTILRSVVQPTVTSEKVRPRLIEGEKRSLLVVFNDTSEDQNARITLPTRYKSATDLYTIQTQNLHSNILQISVPFANVSVLRLE